MRPKFELEHIVGCIGADQSAASWGIEFQSVKHDLSVVLFVSYLESMIRKSNMRIVLQVNKLIGDDYLGFLWVKFPSF